MNRAIAIPPKSPCSEIDEDSHKNWLSLIKLALFITHIRNIISEDAYCLYICM